MKSKTVNVLHELTHRVPGVPAHDNTPTVPAPHNSRHNPQPRNSTTHHHAPPRVLIGWQNWIASLGRGSR
jgi:hypothetical protein